jgi:hypothetical protein
MSLLVKHTAPDLTSTVEAIRNNRAACLVQATALVLSLKRELLPQSDVVMFAYMKTAEGLAKSLLSKCLPFATQDELSVFAAQTAGLQSRDLILTFLIELTLVMLRTAASDMVKQCALKVLVHLTVTKPYVPTETREMKIKYFKMELPALIQLKDYICLCITQMGEDKTDRAAVKSLTQLMCEFDTMSDRGEVLDALYTSAMTAMATV